MPVLAGPSVRSSVRPSVTNLANTIFRKQMSRFCCKLAQVVHWARGQIGQLLGSRGQRSRSLDAEVRFGGMGDWRKP